MPETVSVVTLNRTTKQGAISLVEKWQCIAPNFSEDVLLKFAVQSDMSGGMPIRGYLYIILSG